jgi:hypothetical protein
MREQIGRGGEADQVASDSLFTPKFAKVRRPDGEMDFPTIEKVKPAQGTDDLSQKSNQRRSEKDESLSFLCSFNFSRDDQQITGYSKM